MEVARLVAQRARQLEEGIAGGRRGGDVLDQLCNCTESFDGCDLPLQGRVNCVHKARIEALELLLPVQLPLLGLRLRHKIDGLRNMRAVSTSKAQAWAGQRAQRTSSSTSAREKVMILDADGGARSARTFSVVCCARSSFCLFLMRGGICAGSTQGVGCRAASDCASHTLLRVLGEEVIECPRGTACGWPRRGASNVSFSSLLKEASDWGSSGRG